MYSPPIVNADLNLVDGHGNTPLLLAYRMGRTRAARMLLAAGANPKARAPDGWEAVQVAALTANTDLIRTAVLAFLGETDAAFDRRLPTLQAALRAMPDFTLRMTWEFSSWVPLVSRLLPSDVYTIYKRGSSLRLDTTLLAMSGLKWERGSISLVLWGDDMPSPGAMYVMDNEMKTAADARMAFTMPQDQSVQDWVRKLLTQKQKQTDYWARDVVMAPALKQGLVGGFLRGIAKLAVGDDVPRGRVSEGQDAKTPSSPGGSNGGSGGAASPSAVVHVDDPRQVTADVGVWANCAVYEMRNFCVRDVEHRPILPELKLRDWWKPEYSREATDADVAAVRAEAAGGAPAAGAAGGAAGAAEGGGDAHHRHRGGRHHHGKHKPAGHSGHAHHHHGHHAGGGGKHAAGGAGAAASEEEPPPEAALHPLRNMLKAIRSGKINEKNAASATLEEVEGMGFSEALAAQTVETYTFQEYFGWKRAAAPAGAKAEREAALVAIAAAAAAAAQADAGGEEADGAAGGTGAEPAVRADAAAAPAAEASAPALPPPIVDADGSYHRASGKVGVVREENTTVDDKTMDLKVLFSKDFPITVRATLNALFVAW